MAASIFKEKRQRSAWPIIRLSLRPLWLRILKHIPESRHFVAVTLLLVVMNGLAAKSEEAVKVDPAAEPQALNLMDVRAEPEITIDDDPRWHDRLLALFEEVVLHDEGKRWRGINKWSNAIDVSLRGDAARDFESYVTRLATEFAELIGLPISLNIVQGSSRNTLGDIDIFITYKKDFRPFILKPDASNNGLFTCALLPRVDRGRIRRASIWINAGVLDKATGRACLLEEFTQSLGLFGETEQETETILNDHIGYEGLGAIDRMLIRMLYDPRVITGVRNDMALATASTVLDDLLDDVRKRAAASSNEHE